MCNHLPPHVLHDQTVLDDKTTEWLLKIYPEIHCSQAVILTTGCKQESIRLFLI